MDHFSLQGLLSFEEVTVRFTEKEWALLDSSQKALYREVMLGNYRMAASLGKDTLSSWWVGKKGVNFSSSCFSLFAFPIACGQEFVLYFPQGI